HSSAPFPYTTLFRSFLHHIAELTGEREITFTATEARFNVKYFTAGLRPRQPGHNARSLVVLIEFFIVYLYSKHFAQHLFRDHRIDRKSTRPNSSHVK